MVPGWLREYIIMISEWQRTDQYNSLEEYEVVNAEAETD